MDLDAVTWIITLALLARWACRQLRRAQNELEQKLMHLNVQVRELESATREAATRIERSTNVLLQSAATTSVETRNVREDVSALPEAIRGLRNDSSRHAGERVVQRREPAVDRAGEDGTEDEKRPSQFEESQHGSDWHPGMSDDEMYGDILMDEYRSIMEHEQLHGPLLSPRRLLHAGEDQRAASEISAGDGLQREEEVLREPEMPQ